ncbi:MAG: hypothetical protein HYZ28_17555 [Myxococcales bacterium]|nr:hypothetical protein [Myxococcales bacterium]
MEEASTEVCLSCHNTEPAAGHAAINTFQASGTANETCQVCHGEKAEFSVEKAHDISSPYVPPYPRTEL